uniref:C2H2-type domain-containing protein n=1 Tax=Salix viminalis TaxID=40686 RepID=A0A6N2KBL4_SALVM
MSKWHNKEMLFPLECSKIGCIASLIKRLSLCMMLLRNRTSPTINQADEPRGNSSCCVRQSLMNSDDDEGGKMEDNEDSFGDYVEKLDDSPFKCKFCGYKFDAATFISRSKWHLSGVKGQGVKICDKVPEQVQDAARAASSNNDVANPISASAEEQNYGGSVGKNLCGSSPYEKTHLEK